MYSILYMFYLLLPITLEAKINKSINNGSYGSYGIYTDLYVKRNYIYLSFIIAYFYTNNYTVLFNIYSFYRFIVSYNRWYYAIV